MDDQQGLDNTCGERVMVECLALAGVIQPTDQPALALECWQIVNPGVDRFAPGAGTSVGQLLEVRDYLSAKYGHGIDMQPVYATEASINGAFAPGSSVALAVRLDALRPELGLTPDGHWLLGRGDNGQFVHYLDSCASVDFSPDQETTASFVTACADLVGDGGQCGWQVTVH